METPIWMMIPLKTVELYFSMFFSSAWNHGAGGEFDQIDAKVGVEPAISSYLLAFPSKDDPTPVRRCNWGHHGTILTIGKRFHRLKVSFPRFLRHLRLWAIQSTSVRCPSILCVTDKYLYTCFSNGTHSESYCCQPYDGTCWTNTHLDMIYSYVYDLMWYDVMWYDIIIGIAFGICLCLYTCICLCMCICICIRVYVYGFAYAYS